MLSFILLMGFVFIGAAIEATATVANFVDDCQRIGVVYSGGDEPPWKLSQACPFGMGG